VTSPASAGCHRLLREFDAVCVVDADQMAELAGGGEYRSRDGRRRPSDAVAGSARSPERLRATPAAADDPTAVRVLDALSTRRPRELPDVARRAGLSVPEAMSALGQLEAEGIAERRASGWLRRRAG
jgi:DNA processing protein